MAGNEDVFELPQQNEDQDALVTSNAEQEMVSSSPQSSQKHLQGLDNITAEGTEAIDNVTDVLKTLGDLGSEAT